MTSQDMTDDRFWALIGRPAAHSGDADRQLVALRAVLGELGPSEIEAFDGAFRRAVARAYSWDLWGAAYVINGGAGDDAFEYFRCWLIARGRDVFEAAVADPETLADALPSGFQGEADFEELAYVAGDLWSEKTGRKVSELPSTGAPLPPEPSGVPFEEDAADLARRYPKLWARFGF